jgi:signal transduction histidine kinase
MIFVPFFTTKDEGEGTGLGLSIVYGLVNTHKGRIKAVNQPDSGTTFIIELPIKH